MTEQAAPGNGGAKGRRRMSFVPEEMCVVVSLTALPEERDAQDALAGRIHDAVRGQLNAFVAPLVAFAARTGGRVARFDLVRRGGGMFDAVEVTDTGVGRDLAFSSAVWRGVRPARGGLFQPLARVRGLPPFVLLRPPPPAGREAAPRSTPPPPATVLCFYRVASGRGDEDEADERRTGIVRELVNGVNRLRPDASDTGGQWRILAATPNWLTNTAEEPATGGSPGTPPEPVEGPEPSGDPSERLNWTFRFADPATANGESLKERMAVQRREPEAGGNVVVAVLDTCPQEEDVRAAAAQFAGSHTAPNLWYRAVLGDNPVRIGRNPALPGDAFAHLLAVVPDWGKSLDAWYATRSDNDDKEAESQAQAELGANHYDIRDHGLFVAGIIKDIAPTAAVHLIRVLDHTGVGDLFAIATELAHLPLRFADEIRAGKRVIVNLSLTASLPPSDRLLREWFRESHGDAKELTRRWSDVCRTLDATHRSLAALMDWLAGQGILVVAAAGNDSYRKSPATVARHSPALPARYDNVLGVAAINREGKPASYSNRGDEVVFGNGVATYGGDAQVRPPTANLDADPDSGVIEIADGGGTRDAVIGLYSATNFPGISSDTGEREPNKTGWAYWSGTSFAAPIIAGIAANLWADAPPTDGPETIIGMIRNAAQLDEQSGNDGLAVNAIEAQQIPS